jgi:hypothetical protein
MTFLSLLAAQLLALQPLPAQRATPGEGGLPSLLAPVRFEMVLGSGPDGRRICRVAVNGEENASDLLCAMFVQQEGTGGFDDMPADVSITASVTMALDGEEVPPRSIVDRGELVFDSSARVSVDRSGRISDCQVLGAHLRGALAGMQGTGVEQGMPDLCNVPGLTTEAMFRTAPGGGPESRTGTMRMELYIRSGVSRTTA